MSDDRLAKLEQELQQLRAAMIEMRDHMLYVGGQKRMLEGAVLALLASQQDRAVIFDALAWHLDRIDADIVSRSESEAHLKGAQDAADVLRNAVNISRRPPNIPG